MDDETGAAFARMERWFELRQAQHQEFRAEVNARFDALERGMQKLGAELRAEFQSAGEAGSRAARRDS